MEIISPTFNQIVNSKNPKCKLYPEYKKVVDSTIFLKDTATFKERWWYIQNNITSPVLCLCGCEKVIKTPWKTKFLQGHSNKSDVVKQNKKNALMEKYGVDNVSKLETVKNKKKETTFKSIGVTSPFDRKFMEPIWMEKFGVNNPSKVPYIQEKIQKWHKENQKLTIESRTEKFLHNFFNSLIDKNRELGDFEILCKKEDYKGICGIYEFKCKKCNKVLVGRTQKRFCSNSCSNSFNNIGARKHGNAPGDCKICGGEGKYRGRWRAPAAGDVRRAGRHAGCLQPLQQPPKARICGPGREP